MPGDDSILAAARWVEGTLLGSLASGLAVIAVATLGYQMLSGQISIRSGIRMVLGCFILFGAPALAHMLMVGARNFSDTAGPGEIRTGNAEPASRPAEIPASPRGRTSDPFDPYSGASPYN